MSLGQGHGQDAYTYRKLCKLEKNINYEIRMVWRGPTDSDLDHDLEIKNEGHLKAKLIYSNGNSHC